MSSTHADTALADLEVDGALRASYVQAMAGLASGVTIVAAIGDDHIPAGLTTTSVVSVSADPPMVCMSVRHRSRTLSVIHQSGVFSVNILRPCGRPAAERFASRVDDKFAGVPWRVTDRGVPWLPTMSAHALVCRIVDCLPAGDHRLLVGQVESVEHGAHQDEAPDSLVYWRRRWYDLT